MHHSAKRLFLPCTLMLAAVAPMSVAQTHRALLTIDGLNLGADQYVASFRISTWNVRVLSECSVPTSWKVEVERLQEPEGLLTARSDVHGERLREIAQMFLVEVSDDAAKGGPHPPPFSGSVNLVSTDTDNKRTHRKLKPENFRLIDAQSCPAPAVAAAH